METNTENASPVTVTVRPLSGAIQQMVAEAMRQPSIIDDLIVETPAQAQAVAELLRGLKAKATSLEEARFAITRPMDEAKARVMDMFRPGAEALAAAELRVKGKLLAYQAEVSAAAERQRQQAQREAEDAERARLEAEAEAQALADSGADTEAVIAALDKADAAASTAATAATVAVIAANAPASSTKIAGTSSRKKYRVQRDAAGLPVIDMGELIAAAATNPHLRAYLMPNVQALDAFATAAKTAAVVPGVTFEQSIGIAAPRR